MGLFDFMGGGTPAQKAAKLKTKVTQKYGDPLTRQKAIDQLAELPSSDAIPVLLTRFTFTVEPQTTDADEKQHVFDLITDQGAEAIAPVIEFLKKSDQASSWGLRILEKVQPDAVVNTSCELLSAIGASYTRDPEKKLVLLQYLEGKPNPAVGPAAIPLLEDMSDEIKLAAIKTLASVKHQPARDAFLTLLVSEETAKRVRDGIIEALVQCEFPVQGFREKVEARLPTGYFVEHSGVVRRREASGAA